MEKPESIFPRIIWEKTESTDKPVGSLCIKSCEPAKTELKRKVIRQGNSFMLSIPPEAIEKMRLREGDRVIAVVDQDCLIYRKVRRN